MVGATFKGMCYMDCMCFAMLTPILYICNVPRLNVNPEIPNPSGGTMQNNSVITADLTNRTFGA